MNIEKKPSKTYDKHLILQIKSCVVNQMVKAHVKGHKTEQQKFTNIKPLLDNKSKKNEYDIKYFVIS